MIQVPLRPDLPNFSEQLVLDGREYDLEFRWNAREQAWYMHVRLTDGTEVMDSVKLVLGYVLGARSVDPNRPGGFFWLQDSSGAGVDPGLTDLGDRVLLHYVTAAEAAAAVAGG